MILVVSHGCTWRLQWGNWPRKHPKIHRRHPRLMASLPSCRRKGLHLDNINIHKHHQTCPFRLLLDRCKGELLKRIRAVGKGQSQNLSRWILLGFCSMFCNHCQYDLHILVQYVKVLVIPTYVYISFHIYTSDYCDIMYNNIYILHSHIHIILLRSRFVDTIGISLAFGLRGRPFPHQEFNPSWLTGGLQHAGWSHCQPSEGQPSEMDSSGKKAKGMRSMMI